jgi:uncharacterized membrane protein
MIRTLLWILAGLLLGGVVHIVVILAMPLLAEDRLSDRLAALGADDRVVVLEPPAASEPNPFGLDPSLVHAVCAVDLANGPAFMAGTLPNAFWSVSIIDAGGTVVYSTTNRDGIGRILNLGIFNAAQTRLLAQQEIDIEEGLLVVEAPSNQLFVIVRLAPPHQAMAGRYAESLAAVTCGSRPA